MEVILPIQRAFLNLSTKNMGKTPNPTVEANVTKRMRVFRAVRSMVGLVAAAWNESSINLSYPV